MLFLFLPNMARSAFQVLRNLARHIRRCTCTLSEICVHFQPLHPVDMTFATVILFSCWQTHLQERNEGL